VDDVATVKFEEALKKFPYDADTHNHLGILYFEQKDFHKAEEKFITIWVTYLKNKTA
jgi:TolA-binding protein